MALITAEEARTWLKVPQGSDADTIIDLLVESVSAAAQRYCGRVFASTSYDEYLTGDGTGVLILRNTPVVSISSITIEGGTALQAGWDKDYVLTAANGIVRLTAGAFPRTPGGVRVQYTAGYAAIPADLKIACLKAVAFDYHAQDKRRQGITHLTTPAQSADYIEDEYPRDVLEVWKRYRRLVVA